MFCTAVSWDRRLFFLTFENCVQRFGLGELSLVREEDTPLLPFLGELKVNVALAPSLSEHPPISPPHAQDISLFFFLPDRKVFPPPSPDDR